MSQNYDCPNCGGAVPFQSSIAVWAVCPHCRSMVVRHDVNVEAIGVVAVLPPDMSPLRLGATGEFDGTAFTLIGRVRVAYDEGSWNEWFAHFGDGRDGWVAEAQGFFMVSFAVAPPDGFPDKSGAFQTGNVLEIAGQSYVVADSKETTSLGGEGELPFVAMPGRKAVSIDLGGAAGQFANAEISDDGLRLFVGRYARFDDLKFSNLRTPPGWEEDPSQPKLTGATALQCPGCGAAVVLRAAGFSMSAVCGSCGSVIDTATPELALLRQARARERIEPRIPLGRRGELFGVLYEVIGFQHVDDGFGGWVEYLLFNPWEGFVWLVSYQGHWSFVRRLFEQPSPHPGFASKEVVQFEGRMYQIFDTSKVTTDYVLGEFYWKVAVGMPVTVTDYVQPPRILSEEVYPESSEQTWSLGEYVEPSVIEKAFQLERPLLEPVGTYLNQPNPYAAKAAQLKWLVPIFLAALLIVQLISAGRASGKIVAQANGVYQAGPTNAVVITDSFAITGGSQALAYTLTAPVDNNWIELEIELVNADTHQVTATREQGIEFYHGYDDGYWSEGKRTQRVIVPAIPPGTYYLTVEASADRAVMSMPYTVTVARGVVVWSNFWIALAVLLLYPLYCWARAYTFERARWLESDFTPMIYFANTND